MRWVSTRVLPEPAPARMSSGPAPWVTASLCSGLRPSRRASAAACGIVRLTIVRLTDDIRERAAWVAVRARRVRIGFDAIDAYAATLPAEPPPSPDLGGADDEERAAFSLTLNAINFGSGWFPTLRKAPGVSGFRTVEAGVRANGPWTAEELVAMTPERIAAAIGQDPAHELMGLFAAHLRELGERVRDEHGGSFLALARSGGGSAVALASYLATWPGWYDVSPYDGERVPLWKRAQIAAGDLATTGIAAAD